MIDLWLVVLAYISGSIPFAYIFSRLFSGLDIRAAGSGNVGGMNVLRYVGFLPGIATIAADIGKGALAVFMVGQYGSSPWCPWAAALGCVLGHNFTPFLRFKGGKGLAAALGAMLVLSPKACVYVIPVMAAAALLLKDANTGAGIGVLFLPAVIWRLTGEPGWSIIGAGISAAIAVKHVDDFKAYLVRRRKR